MPPSPDKEVAEPRLTRAATQGALHAATPLPRWGHAAEGRAGPRMGPRRPRGVPDHAVGEGRSGPLRSPPRACDRGPPAQPLSSRRECAAAPLPPVLLPGICFFAELRRALDCAARDPDSRIRHGGSRRGLCIAAQPQLPPRLRRAAACARLGGGAPKRRLPPSDAILYQLCLTAAHAQW